MPLHEMDHFLQPTPHRKAGKREGPIPKEGHVDIKNRSGGQWIYVEFVKKLML